MENIGTIKVWNIEAMTGYNIAYINFILYTYVL